GAVGSSTDAGSTVDAIAGTDAASIAAASTGADSTAAASANATSANATSTDATSTAATGTAASQGDAEDNAAAGKYRQFWGQFGNLLKEGIVEDNGNRERI